jgi:hypothetical protein
MRRESSTFARNHIRESDAGKCPSEVLIRLLGGRAKCPEQIRFGPLDFGVSHAQEIDL